MARTRATLCIVIVGILGISALLFYITSRPASHSPATRHSTKPAPPATTARSQLTLSIGKINLKTPITPNVDSRKQSTYQNALQHGVAHMLGTALPNERGNTVLFGHSAVPTARTDTYSTIFNRLGELAQGDVLSINGPKGDRYSYVVKEKKVIANNDVSFIQQQLGARLTLITCWPIGDNRSRLVVWATPQ